MHLTSRCAFGKRVYDFLNYVKSVQMKIVKKCQLTVIFDVAYSEKLHASSNSDSNSDSDALYASSNSDSDSDCDFPIRIHFQFPTLMHLTSMCAFGKRVNIYTFSKSSRSALGKRLRKLTHIAPWRVERLSCFERIYTDGIEDIQTK